MMFLGKLETWHPIQAYLSAYQWIDVTEAFKHPISSVLICITYNQAEIHRCYVILASSRFNTIAHTPKSFHSRSTKLELIIPAGSSPPAATLLAIHTYLTYQLGDDR